MLLGFGNALNYDDRQERPCAVLSFYFGQPPDLDLRVLVPV
jgi:hypothetical protein